MSGRRARAVARFLVPGLVAVVLTACSGDPEEAYCEEVQEQQPELTALTAEGGPAALLEALPVFETLRDAAPTDVRDEWDVVVGRLGALDAALADAGVDPAAYDRDEPPEGLTAEQRTAIGSAARQLATPEMVRALNGVQQQARDVCGTSLTL